MSKSKHRGEALSQPVYWENKQWAVTPYGIEAVDGRYTIEAERLGESHTDGWPAWCSHMADKDWVDLGAFLEAFTHALAIHMGRHKAKFSADWWSRVRRYFDKMEAARSRRMWDCDDTELEEGDAVLVWDSDRGGYTREGRVAGSAGSRNAYVDVHGHGRRIVEPNWMQAKDRFKLVHWSELKPYQCKNAVGIPPRGIE